MLNFLSTLFRTSKEMLNSGEWVAIHPGTNLNHVFFTNGVRGDLEISKILNQVRNNEIDSKYTIVKFKMPQKGGRIGEFIFVGYKVIDEDEIIKKIIKVTNVKRLVTRF